MSIDNKIDGVRLHHDFFTGTHTEGASVDYKHLKPAELRCLSKWINAILAKVDHDGRNKPSYVEANGEPAKRAEGYIKAVAWHYHCGPTYSTREEYKKTKWNLPQNLEGWGSDEVVHYSLIKHSQHPVKAITVFAFSRKHEPFPKSDGNHRFPYRKKLNTLPRSIDWGQIAPPAKPTQSKS